MVVSEKYLDCVNNSMRDSAFIPGTGPFILTQHTPGESWKMDKNVDYFIEHLPYFDGLDLAALAQAQARAAAVYGGQVDAVMQITKEDMRRAWDNPDKYHSQIGNFFNGSIFAFNTNRPPFDDVRMRRAIHLVVDKMTLHELAAKTSFNGEEPGGWFLPDWQTGGSPYSRSGDELATIPGFRVPTAEDIAEAKRLLAEAGYPDGAGLNVSFLQRGNQPNAAVAAIQDMIRKNLNVEMKIELSDEGGYYDRVLNKDFDTTGTFTAAEIIDPGPWFTRFLADGGSWNYGGWFRPENRYVDEADQRRAGRRKAGRAGARNAAPAGRDRADHAVQLPRRLRHIPYLPGWPGHDRHLLRRIQFDAPPLDAYMVRARPRVGGA